MEMSWYVVFSCIFLTIIAQVLACDERNCVASNGSVCNEQGTCDCGVCKCQGSYSGPTCEECPTCPSPCEIYKDCVGCRIFGTGPLGSMNCIVQCDNLATYIPVDKNDFDNPADDEDRVLCSNLNKKYCMESFRIGGMREGYRDLHVRMEEDCSAKYLPTEPSIIEVPLETVKTEKTGPDSGKYENPEDAAAVSGSNQGQRVGNSGAAVGAVSNLLIFIVTVLSCFL